MPRGVYQGGGSLKTGKATMREWLRARSFATVVDFGTGLGELGAIARRVYPHARILGCDVYAPAIQRHAAAPGKPYDEVVVCDAVTFAGDAPSNPRVLWCFGDMLEHVSPETARALMLGNPEGYILVALPIGLAPQKGKRDNPAEAHLWTVYPTDIAAVGRSVVQARVEGFTSRRVDSAGEVYEDTLDRPCYHSPQGYSHYGMFLLGPSTPF